MVGLHRDRTGSAAVMPRTLSRGVPQRPDLRGCSLNVRSQAASSGAGLLSMGSPNESGRRLVLEHLTPTYTHRIQGE